MEWNPKFLPTSLSKKEKQTNKQKISESSIPNIESNEKTSLAEVHIKTEKKKSYFENIHKQI